MTIPRTQQTEEVQVLKFFEEAPLDKAEMLFNIVKEKMRARSGSNPASNGSGKRRHKSRIPPSDAMSSTEASAD